MNAAERDHPGYPSSRADDDASADLFAEDPVRGADIVASLRRDRRRLQPEPVLADGTGGIVHHAVLCPATRLEREVETRELELEADHVGLEHAQGFLQQFLPGFVALQHHDRFDVHVRGH